MGCVCGGCVCEPTDRCYRLDTVRRSTAKFAKKILHQMLEELLYCNVDQAKQVLLSGIRRIKSRQIDDCTQ